MNFPNDIKWSPSEYAEAAVIAREAGLGMLARLDWMICQPAVILDVGCGTGEMSAELQRRYPGASVIGIDSSPSMLEHAAIHVAQRICTLAERLPFAAQSVDLIFANFLLPWHGDVKALFQEWKRVLRPDGVLMFTALGPDTFKEWHAELDGIQVPWQVDMHEIGDALLREGFADPVLDVDYYTTSYRDNQRFAQELIASGMCIDICTTTWPASAEGSWETTYEVVFAHAFAPAISDAYAAQDGVVRIPLAQLRNKLGSR